VTANIVEIQNSKENIEPIASSIKQRKPAAKQENVKEDIEEDSEDEEIEE